MRKSAAKPSDKAHLIDIPKNLTQKYLDEAVSRDQVLYSKAQVDRCEDNRCKSKELGAHAIGGAGGRYIDLMNVDVA